MPFVLPLRGIKKRDWLFASVLAFILPLAFSLFENRSLSLALEPAFLRMALGCAVFFSAVACVFLSARPWMTVAAVPAVGALLFLPEIRSLVLFCFLPTLLLIALLRIFSPAGDRKRLFPPLCAAFSLLLFAADGVLLSGALKTPFRNQFLYPLFNSRLYGLFTLICLFALYAALFILCRVRAVNASAAEPAGKKEKKKPPVGRQAVGGGSFSFLSCVPVFLYFLGLALLFVRLWNAADAMVPHPMLICLSVLFVLLSAFAEAPDGSSPRSAGSRMQKR